VKDRQAEGLESVNGDVEVAFVLGAGSSMGAVQAGMLKALTERGIRPDVVVGSSVGALTGSVFAGHPEGERAAQVERLWREVTTRDFVPPRWPTPYLGLLRRREGLYSHDRVRAFLARILPAAAFEDLGVPFHCVATDADDGQERWFDRGPLIDPLLASLSTPVAFPAVRIEGRRYIDGGTVNDVPVDRAAALGARSIYVMEAGRMHRTFEPKRPFDAAKRALALARRHRYEAALARLPADVTVHVMPTGDPEQSGFSKLDRSGELIDRAYAASLAYLENITAPAPAPAPAPA
jgi:NTE family protein